MQALVFERKELKYAVAAVTSRISPGVGVQLGPLRLKTMNAPDLPGENWHRVFPRLTGICGSDLATVEGKSSRYFEPHVSFPFVPGHEVVGTMEDGTRVALEPVLGPESRGLEKPHPDAAPGDSDDFAYLLAGNLDDGIQVGFCASTGGGWGTEFVAHQSQLHEVPDLLSDEAAVMLEPAAGGIHAALKADIQPGDTVVIQGAGTMGLCALAAVRRFTEAGTVIVVAKYPQQRSFAEQLGADIIVSPSETRRAVRRHVGCQMIGNDLTSGADVTIDAVGSSSSLSTSISITRPRGKVLVLGMPGMISLDLTPLWHRETQLIGAYTYSAQQLADGTMSTDFRMAFDLVEAKKLGQLVSARYPLDRYKDALRHAAEAGQRGAIKVVFDQTGS